jgi:hypothetical protein
MSAAKEFPMRRFTFTPEDLATIRRDRYQHPHPRVQQKMEDLWLKSQGLSYCLKTASKLLRNCIE